MSKLQDLKHIMCHIEALLKEAEISQDTAQQREHTKRIETLTSKVKTSLLTIEARQGDDIKTQELKIVWTSLVYVPLQKQDDLHGTLRREARHLQV